MTDHKSEPAPTTVFVGLKQSGKSSAVAALCETGIARCFPLVIFDLQEDHLSLTVRSLRSGRRSRSRRSAP